MLRSIDREGTRSMIFVSAVFAATANKRLKSRANSPEQAQKKFRTLINDLCESSVGTEAGHFV
ncbi:hypothetical protein MPL3365_170266 [Mesorhizobium plurifarium]|uniref:Uncharacterized protein n=1 Tax=Mesorhizobium plurifarium TaxID=69974 RepID=A0A090GTG4_MESPL|nr:hypothetical protein MPL3365_170266 [Mesorhizobium plurifarium]